MDMPVISVIVPAYNIEAYLPRCLESLAAQTYENLEIIVVNDGSTDSTGKLIDAWTQRDKRIVAIHKENGGVSTARLAGIKAARGSWIGFVDGDDYAEREMFAFLLKNAEENSADISHCGYQMVFPNGRVDLYHGTGKTMGLDRNAGLEALICGDVVEPGLWNKLFKRHLFEGLAEWMDPTVRINEDLLMNYYLFSQTEYSYYEDVPLYHYMLRKGSAAASKTQRFKITDPVRVAEAILGETADNPILYKDAMRRYLYLLTQVAQQKDWLEEAFSARKKLRKLLWESRDLKVSLKVRLMAIGVAYLTPLYLLVRRIYECVTGVNKKYDLG